MKTFFAALGCVAMMAASVAAQETPAAPVQEAAPAQEAAVEPVAENIVESGATVEGSACCQTRARRHVVRTRAVAVKSRFGNRRGRCCR